ncbi:MAG TPA: hypothetical protein VF426_04235 [Marmoricola sp.]
MPLGIYEVWTQRWTSLLALIAGTSLVSFGSAISFFNARCAERPLVGSKDMRIAVAWAFYAAGIFMALTALASGSTG